MRHLELHIFPWVGALIMEAIKPTELVRCLHRIKERGNLETAQRVREAVQHVFQYAVDVGALEPAKNFVNSRTGGLPAPRARHYAAITDPQKLGHRCTEAVDRHIGAGHCRKARYRRLQEAGKQLRKKTSNPAVLAEFAAKKISVDRLARNGDAQEQSDGPIVPTKVAYIIDQVKRPEEVTLLRALYRNLFYVAGVTRIYSKREAALVSESIRKSEVDELMEIDRMEDGSDGQQLDKTLFLADYFIRNDSMAADDKQEKLNRLSSFTLKGWLRGNFTTCFVPSVGKTTKENLSQFDRRKPTKRYRST